MTTFRRLSVAVYLTRLFLLMLAVLSLSAEVRAQDTIKVGYYDMVVGAGVAAEQEPPIVAAGFTPVQLQTLTPANLAPLRVLFVQNPSNTVYGAAYLARRADIQSAVTAGMVLVIHDRAVGPTTTRQILPGSIGYVPAGLSNVLGTRMAAGPTSTNIDVSDLSTAVASGPGGIVTNANLDNGNASNQGWVNLAGVPAGRKGLLHTGTSPTIQSVTFSYPLGLGFVIYSSIPLDFYLKPPGPTQPPQPRDNFRNIYAPNVLAYAGCSLRPSQPTLSVSPATGYYGGTATLKARVRCGSTNLAGLTVVFSLNGTSVGSAQTDASGTATLTNASLGATLDSAIAAGTYAVGVSASFAGAGLFTASAGTAALEVTKAPLAVTGDDTSKLYGAELPAFTVSYSGFVNGETLATSGVTGTPSLTTVATPASPVGYYPIMVGLGTLAAANYSFDFTDATLTVTPAAPLTITANNKTRLYGGTNPTFDGTIVGIQGEDNITATYVTEATSSSPVGTYDIVPALLDPGGRLANYEGVTVVNGVLTITRAASLTVTANNTSRVYGGTNSTFDGTIAGIQGQDNITASYATEATSSSSVGTYDIVPTLVDPDGRLANYEPATVVNGVLTITRTAALTVTANNKNRLYGGTNPTFDGTIVGIQGQDNITASYATQATSSSPVGTYDIVATLVDPDGRLANYEPITVVNGALTINRAPLTVTANDRERLAGTANPVLTVRYAGFVNSDTPADLDAQPTVITTAVIGSPAGTYPIVVSGALDSNYAITHVNGTLTVSPTGRMHGGGFIDAGDARNHFNFDVREGLTIGERGTLTLRLDYNDLLDPDDLFVSQAVTSVIFSDNPAYAPGGNSLVDTVVFAGVGLWNGAGATFEAMVSDKGEPGSQDTFSITVLVAGDEVATFTGLLLGGGNVQSNRLPGNQ